jgi:hypothetical protein
MSAAICSLQRVAASSHPDLGDQVFNETPAQLRLHILHLVRLLIRTAAFVFLCARTDVTCNWPVQEET